MNKATVLAALKRGDTVCHTSSRWHVGSRVIEAGVHDVYRFDVFKGTRHSIIDFSKCFIHVGGVGSDGD